MYISLWECVKYSKYSTTESIKKKKKKKKKINIHAKLNYEYTSGRQ